jgi:molecular chaperone GrpE
MTSPRDPLEFLADGPVTEAPQEAAQQAVPLPMEPDTSAVVRLERELADVRDRHARLAAEFDNFRKRSARERAELGDRAQAGLLSRMLDALDDLHRAVTSDAASTPAEALRGAINAVDTKLWKEVQAAGLERIDPVGSAFDPTQHEAVSLVPTAEPGQDQIVAATFQVGYRFKGILIRPARVAVYSSQGGA